jgi:hypothetical protein
MRDERRSCRSRFESSVSERGVVLDFILDQHHIEPGQIAHAQYSQEDCWYDCVVRIQQ